MNAARVVVLLHYLGNNNKGKSLGVFSTDVGFPPDVSPGHLVESADAEPRDPEAISVGKPESALLCPVTC